MTPIERKDRTTNITPGVKTKKIDRDQSKKLLKEIKKISKLNIQNRTTGFNKKKVFVRTGHR